MSAPTWSATRLATFRRCVRLHHYRYVLGLGEPSTDTQEFGKVGHSVLETLLRAQMGDVIANAVVMQGIPMDLPDAYEAARLSALIDGYRLRWESTRWEVLGVEVPFEYELAGHIINGRMDGIVRDLADGRVYVLEHKFTSSDTSPGSAYWERLTLDAQVSIYCDAAAMLGYDCAGVIYDVIGKPALKPKLATPVEKRKMTAGKGCKACGGKAGVKGLGYGPVGGDCIACKGSGWSEAPRLYEGQRDTGEPVQEFRDRVIESIAANPDDYYRRAVIVRTEDELPKMRTDLLDTIKLARAAELFDVQPRNPDSCLRYGSRCFFWDACTGAASIDDSLRFPRRARVEQAAQTTP